MNQKLLFFTIALLIQLNLSAQYSGEPENKFRFSGYIKNMPSVQFSENFDDALFNNLLHNRLNFEWNLNNSITVSLETRNRLFAGETYKRYPILADLLENDHGYADLSKVWVSGKGWALHSIIDRLYLDWKKGKWQTRAGRQRINWGINMVSNPNDLFNNYSFFDFDYEERPGTDAIRIQYFPNGMSRFEIAGSPSKDAKKAVVASLYAFNHNGYDIQTLAGYFKNRLAVGGGWAGNIKASGFKGEFTLFYDLEKELEVTRTNLVAAISFDHLFSNGIYGFAEFLYNGGYNRQTTSVFDLNQPLQADNIFLSEFATTFSLMYSFSPIFSGSATFMYLPDAEAIFLSPSVSWSVATNLDLQFVSQVFRGSKNSIFNETGTGLYFALKWSF